MNLDIPVDALGREKDRERSIDIGGNTIYLRATDPYGFVTLSIEKGQLPSHLKTATFTSFEYARIAVQNYLNNKKKE